MAIKLGSQGLILPPNITRAYAGANKVYEKAPVLPANEIFRMVVGAGGVTDEIAGATITTGGTAPAYPVDGALGEYVANLTGGGWFVLPSGLTVLGAYTKAVTFMIPNVTTFNNIWSMNAFVDAHALYAHDVGSNNLVVGNASELEGAVSPNGAIVDGQWHHVVQTHDGSGGVTVYLDGAQVASDTGLDHVDSHTMFIGGFLGNASYSLRGYVHKARYYDRALTLAEAQTLYGIDLPA